MKPRRRLTAGRVLIFLALVALLAACPLPFEFAPLDGDGPSGSSNDPANPGITAAPALRIFERTSGSERGVAASPVNVDLFLSTETRGASIFYRTDGDDPIPGRDGTLAYQRGEAIPVTGPDATVELRAIAIGPSMYPSLVTARTVTVRYEPAVEPSFSVAPGDYPGDISVAITTSEPGAEIYYTRRTDTEPAADPVPGAAGTQRYTGPITVAGSGTAASIAAIAVRDERLPSSVARGVWTIDYPVSLAPLFSPAPETYEGDVTVTLATQGAGPDAQIYYTVVDGASDAPQPVPGAPGTSVYDGGITIAGPSATRSFAAIVRESGRLDSPVARATYTVQYAPAARPVLRDSDGNAAAPTYSAPTAFTIASSTPGATIWYTTDGSVPVPGGADVASGSSPTVVQIDRSSRIRAVAVADGFVASPELDTTVTLALAAPTVSLASLSAGVVIELAALDGATIFYTIDGSDPTDAANPSRTEYGGPFLRDGAAAVRAYAVRDGFVDSPERAATGSGSGGTFVDYDDFNDGQIDASLWAVSVQFGGRVIESNIFEVADDALAPLDDPTLNVYGWVGNITTGVARATSFASGAEWAFTIEDETIGDFAGGTQGWYVHALRPDGTRIGTPLNNVNVNRTGSSPGTNAGDLDDSNGTYLVALVDARLYVIRNGLLLRVVDASGFDGPGFRIQFEADNAWGVNVSRAGMAVDDVRRVE